MNLKVYNQSRYNLKIKEIKNTNESELQNLNYDNSTLNIPTKQTEI